jgi:alpha-tubulin suppressor-like RCC1 family protein
LAAGYNGHGQIVTGDIQNMTSWTEVLAPGSGAVCVATGTYHSMVLLADGSVLAAGNNSDGQLGTGDKNNRSDWTEVLATGSGAVEIATGNYHSLILLADGRVLTTGRNANGQLGTSNNVDKTTWTAVTLP